MPTATPFIIDDKTFPGPGSIGSFASLLNIVVPLLIIGAALLLLFMLLRGAFIWLTAGDNPENVKNAQKTITFAIFGLIVVVCSFLLVKLIGIIFNIDTVIPIK